AAPEVTTTSGGAWSSNTKTVKMPFTAALPVTDIKAVFAGTNGTEGSFDPGPNMLIAQAIDVRDKTTFDQVPFVVGPALVTPQAITSALRATIATDPSTVHKAFTLVLNNDVTLADGNPALREFFDNFIKEFSANLANCMLQPHEFCCDKELDMPWWTCNPDVTFCTSPQLTQDEAVNFANTFDITVTPKNGLLTIHVQIP